MGISLRPPSRAAFSRIYGPVHTAYVLLFWYNVLAPWLFFYFSFCGKLGNLLGVPSSLPLEVTCWCSALPDDFRKGAGDLRGLTFFPRGLVFFILLWPRVPSIWSSPRCPFLLCGTRILTGGVISSSLPDPSEFWFLFPLSPPPPLPVRLFPPCAFLSVLALKSVGVWSENQVIALLSPLGVSHIFAQEWRKVPASLSSQE